MMWVGERGTQWFPKPSEGATKQAVLLSLVKCPFPALFPVPGGSVHWESGCFHWGSGGWVLFRSLSLPLCFYQELTFLLLVPDPHNFLYGPGDLWGGVGWGRAGVKKEHPFTVGHLNILVFEEIHGAHEEDSNHNPVHHIQRGEVHRCLQQGEL